MAAEFSRPFVFYATVSGLLIEPGIDFDCYQPQLAEEMTSYMEQSINYHYRAEPPLCGSCASEAGENLFG